MFWKQCIWVLLTLEQMNKHIEVGIRWLYIYLHSLVIPGGGSSLCLGVTNMWRMQVAQTIPGPQRLSSCRLSKAQRSSKSNEQVLALFCFARTLPQCSRMILPRNKHHQC